MAAVARGRLFIDGAWREPSGGRYVPVVDPSTRAPYGEAPVGTVDDARAAIDAAHAAEERWADTPMHERSRMLRGIAERLERSRDELALVIASEVGKPIVDARVEVERAADVFRMASEEVRQLTGTTYPADAYPRPAGNERRWLFTVRDPIGVVVAIGPFNFPLNLLAHKIAPALAVGDPVVAKPTTAAPFIALRLAELASDAGLPRGVLNVVVGPGSTVGDALVTHPSTRLVTFTGSTAVGEQIAAKAAARAKRLLLEMGGLDPMIVLEDAPIDRAVAAAARGSFGYAGQVCTASKRLLVAEPIAAKFAAALAERAKTLRLGRASEESTEVGPLIDGSAVERVHGLVQDATGRDARLLAGGTAAPELGGFFYRPTVLDGVPPDARIGLEEPFGPVAPIFRFNGEEEAIRLANGTPYGLQASVFTNDLGKAFRLARRIRAGGVHLNDPTSLRWDALPFGGIKESGVGREGILSAMELMTEVKLVSVNFG